MRGSGLDSREKLQAGGCAAGSRARWVVSSHGGSNTTPLCWLTWLLRVATRTGLPHQQRWNPRSTLILLYAVGVLTRIGPVTAET